MLIVGLTGTSGAGKGYLSSLFKSDDSICVIDTDRVYHRMIEGPSECTSAIKNEFGNVIISPNGGINRKALAKIVFSDKERLFKLNTIAHAHILRKCRSIMTENDCPIAIIDAPQLFESGFDKECDIVVGVIADKEKRIKRIMNRDRIDYEAALKRVNCQHSDNWFKDKCDIIITNNEGVLEKEAKALIAEFKRLYDEKEKKK